MKRINFKKLFNIYVILVLLVTIINATLLGIAALISPIPFLGIPVGIMSVVFHGIGYAINIGMGIKHRDILNFQMILVLISVPFSGVAVDMAVEEEKEVPIKRRRKKRSKYIE